MVGKIENRLEDLEGKTLGVLGLSFKPEEVAAAGCSDILFITGANKVSS